MHSKPTYYKPAFLISLLCFILFCIIAFGVQLNADWINWFDDFIANPIMASATENKTSFFVFITNLGDVFTMSIVVLLFSFFLVWKTKNKRLAIWYISQSILGAAILNLLVKIIFHRERPTIEHLVIQGGFSFPSGHSMGSLICYGGLAFLTFHLYKKSTPSLVVLLVTILFILLIGLSRIYVGVHFPSDVIGGYLLGASWLTLMIGLFPKLIRQDSF